MTASPNDLYREAQRLLRLGQPVFPCRAMDHPTDKSKKAKAPLIAHGLNGATNDRAVVKGWLQKFGSGAALAIPTGIIWDVLDVDIKEGADGRVHLPYLHRLGLLNGCKRVVRTPSGGWHLYFLATPGLTNKANVALGMDVRAKGGYVLAPPSYIETADYKGSYVDVGDTEDSTDEPLRWDLIVSTLQPMNTKTNEAVPLLGYERRSSLASLRGWLSERQSGERNNALHWAVCRCIDNGIDPNELRDVSEMIGLDEAEVDLTISAALRRAGLDAGEMDSEVDILFPGEE